MTNLSLPGISALAFAQMPELPRNLWALLPDAFREGTDAKLRRFPDVRIGVVQSLTARLHLHARLSTLNVLPREVQDELARTEAATWALLCRMQLSMGAHDSACDAGRKLLEQLPQLPADYQVFAADLIKVLLTRVDNDLLVDDVETALTALHERDRAAIAGLADVHKGLAKARGGEVPAALSILRGVAEAGVDIASMVAWYTMSRIFRAEQLAWEEMQCCIRWRDSLQKAESLAIAAYAGRLAERGVGINDVVDMGLRLVSLLRSADRHDEANALIGEFESAGFGERASILRSQEPRAEGWSVHIVADASGQDAAHAHGAIYKQLVAGRNRLACVGLRRVGYEEPHSRVIDPDCDPMEHLISVLPDMVAGLGLEVVPHVLVENALSTYRWMLLREQERPLSGLLIGLLATGHSVTATVVRCIAFPTRIEENRDKTWLKEAVELLMSEFDAVKRREALAAVGRVLERLAPAGARVTVTRI